MRVWEVRPGVELRDAVSGFGFRVWGGGVQGQG